jgi:hypothetical protein
VRRVLGREARDGGGFAGRRVVLPQPRLGCEVRLPRGSRASGRLRASTGIGRRAGGVDADADDEHRARTPARLPAASSARSPTPEPVEVVAGMLAGEMRVARIEQDPLVARRVVEHVVATVPPVPQSTTTARTELVP